MRYNFMPCEDCPLNGKEQNASLLLAGKAMGEVYTDEDYDRMYASLSGVDRRIAEEMESGVLPKIDGETCGGPKKAFFVGKLSCRGYVDI
jgi:hypothetical protein